MVLKCALVLCLVSVFGCEAYVYQRPHYSRLQHYRPFHPFRYNRGISIESDEDESNDESLQKEYASKPHATTYLVSSHNLSWENARDECKAKGMVLASPTSLEQKWELQTYLQTNSLLPVDPYSGYWIGGKRLSADEPWIWEVDGQEVKSLGWLPGEPNGFDGEDCMELKYDYISGWNNYYCSALKRFVCQSKPHIHESEKNNIKNTKFSHIHEEILKEKVYNSDNTKSMDSLNMATTTAASTITTAQYTTPIPFYIVHRSPWSVFPSRRPQPWTSTTNSDRFAHRAAMPVFPSRRPWFYHNEESTSNPQTTSKTSSTTNNATELNETGNTEFSTFKNTAQTETSQATESSSRANLVSTTETANEISSFPTTSKRFNVSSSSVLPWVYLPPTERSINIDQSSSSSRNAHDILMDHLIQRKQEREREFLRGLEDDLMDSTYEEYM